MLGTGSGTLSEGSRLLQRKAPGDALLGEGEPVVPEGMLEGRIQDPGADLTIPEQLATSPTVEEELTIPEGLEQAPVPPSFVESTPPQQVSPTEVQGSPAPPPGLVVGKPTAPEVETEAKPPPPPTFTEAPEGPDIETIAEEPLVDEETNIRDDETIIDWIKRNTQEGGDITRGTSYVTEFSEGRTDEELIEAHKWTKSEEASPWIQRFVGETIYPILKKRGYEAVYREGGELDWRKVGAEPEPVITEPETEQEVEVEAEPEAVVEKPVEETPKEKPKEERVFKPLVTEKGKPESQVVIKALKGVRLLPYPDSLYDLPFIRLNPRKANELKIINKLVDRGYISEKDEGGGNYQLTPEGRDAALQIRENEELALEGLPMENYTPKKGRKTPTLPGGIVRFSEVEFEGGPSWSTSHFLMKGEPPGNVDKSYSKKKLFTPVIEAAPKMTKANPSVDPIGWTADSEHTRVHFAPVGVYEEGMQTTTINAEYYDLFKKNWPDAKFVMDEKAGSMKAMSVYSGDEFVGIIMPMRNEGGPEPGFQKILKAKPAEVKPLTAEQKIETALAAKEPLHKRLRPETGSVWDDSGYEAQLFGPAGSTEVTPLSPESLLDKDFSLKPQELLIADKTSENITTKKKEIIGNIVLHKNTQPDEGPYRITHFYKGAAPGTFDPKSHIDYPNLEEALKAFAYLSDMHGGLKLISPKAETKELPQVEVKEEVTKKKPKPLGDVLQTEKKTEEPQSKKVNIKRQIPQSIRELIYTDFAEASNLDESLSMDEKVAILRQYTPKKLEEVFSKMMEDKFGIRIIKATSNMDVTLDNLMDSYTNVEGMASVLNFPLKAMGFDNSLSLQTVPRMISGPFETAASYSPDLKRIKMGERNRSFAHEWMHALDFHIMEIMGKEWHEGGMSGRLRGYSPKAEKRLKNLRLSAKDLPASWVTGGKEPWQEENTTERIKDAFGNLLNSIFFGDANVAAEIMALEEKIGNARSEGVIEGYRKDIEKLKLGMTHKHLKKTFFFTESESVDFNKDKPYLTVPTELLARSFEAYMANRVELQSQAANYPGTEFITMPDWAYNDRKYTPWPIKELQNPEIEELWEKIYPKDGDRKAIFDAYDKLFEVLAEDYFEGEAAVASASRIITHPLLRDFETAEETRPWKPREKHDAPAGRKIEEARPMER